MAAKDTTTDSASYEKELRAEMAEIREDIAALTTTLKSYGKARASDLQQDAREFTDDVIADSRKALKKLNKQVAKLESNMETHVREHPLQWFLGALGVGLVLTMLMRKGD